MFLIAHRGNIDGPRPSWENNPEYIQSALSKGYHCEIDVWSINDKWYLGHDSPDYLIDKSFLLQNKLWCHAKNLSALENLTNTNATYFWHQNDNYTLTSNNFIWTFPGFPLTKNSICVMPEENPDFKIDACSGICSDFVEDYK
jgi:hypothetical protein